ncbi:MAG: serine hydrolase [Clostridia bacterium]|nr:serine hydrolase [Clostridia bacterium]
MDHKTIARIIKDEIHAAGGTVSVIYKDFDTGEIPFQFAPDYEVPAGDMAKIAILLAAMRRIQEGGMTLEKCVIVPNLWINSDSVAFERGQMSYSIDELLSWMIVANEDTAANVLIEILGLDFINESCMRFGLINTRVECRMGQTRIHDDLRLNVTTAQDILRFFEGIYRNTLFSRPLCEYVGRMFLRHRNHGGFTRYICDDIYTGRLVSDRETVNHEAGIFYLRYVDYFLGIFNSDPVVTPESRRASQRMRARISNIIYNYYLEREDEIIHQPYDPNAPYGENRY